MAKRKKIITIGLVAVVLIAFVGFLFIKLYIFKKPDASVASKKPDVEITARDLVNSFETNEKSANTKFLAKIILVQGVVNNVAETKSDTASEITVYLKDKEETSGVMCSFNKSVLTKDQLKPGDSVKIKGICSGYLMDVVLNKCAIVK